MKKKTATRRPDAELDPDRLRAHEAYEAAINSNEVQRVMAVCDPGAEILQPDGSIVAGRRHIRIRVKKYFKYYKAHWTKIPLRNYVLGEYGFDQGIATAVDTPRDGGKAIHWDCKGILNLRGVQTHIVKAFVMRTAWLAILLGWAIGQRALGQESPPSGLQPGEVRVSLTFVMAADLKPQPPDDEGSRTTWSGGLLVEASFAAKYVAPSQGRRRLRDFRLLSADGIKGDLKETRIYIKPNKVGEGGVTPDPVIRSENWKALAAPVSLPEFDIEIDLESKTWFVREFGDDPNKWFNELTKAQSYVGLDYDLETTTGKRVWKPILLPRLPILNYTVLGLAQSDFHNLGQPQPLQETDGSLSGNVGTKRLEGTDSTGEWLLTWAISDSAPALELRVTAKGFADWRPSVKHYDPERKVIDPGEPLSLTAQVIDPSGKLPAVRIKELRWTLHETSQLPGIAMNYPYQSTETSWDLSIAKRLPTQDKKQELVEKNLTKLKSSVNVWPWDHGGWSTLRVEATLDDGMKLQGKLKSPDGDETDIRLPDRTSDSKIHREWKEAFGVAKEADNEDEDLQALGSRATGDGFSNFEEYRGFYVSAKVGSEIRKILYVSTDPFWMTVFFYDQMNDDDSRAAMQLFAKASRKVAYVLHPGDGLIDDLRVMNANRGNGPTQGSQHAVGIRLLGPPPGIWRPTAPGMKPSTGKVQVPGFGLFQLRTPTLKGRRELYQRGIAQALLNNCGVPFPGDGDQDYTLRIKRGSDGGPEVKTQTGELVTLRNESGHDEGEDWLRQVEHAASARRRLKNKGGDKAAEEQLDPATRKYYVAHQGGQHSGPVDNIMRDTFAEAYRVGNTIILLPADHKAPVGYHLSGSNKSDGSPNRYGDSPNPVPAKEFFPNDHR